ncbi:MAG: MarR family transcriptional regulator [Spirochaetaceae bacterium]|nr:MarR family transcriptional regulator [Spirochaetaceae bacterium]
MNNNQNIVEQLNNFAKMLNQKNFKALITVARGKGLSISQINTLFQLRYNGAIRVSKIADKLGISNAAASQMLQALVVKGFISRKEDHNDRRVKMIEITDSGLELLNISMKHRREWLNSIVNTLTKNEQNLIRRAFEILISKAALIDEVNKNTEQHREKIC